MSEQATRGGRPAHRALVPTIRNRPIPPNVLRVGRMVLRRYGTATARLRPTPDFLLIGAKRCGTTSFYFHLLSHPSVLPMFPTARLLPKARDGKGPHYFDSNFDRGSAWYRGHFPSHLERAVARIRVGAAVSGESSPYYLYHPHAPSRAVRLVPDARLLVLLRDPVERTWSHYREQSRNGVEALSFEEALEAEAARTAGEEERLLADPTASSHAHEQQSYRRQSEYVHGLRRWLVQFPRDRLLVLPSEDYYTDPTRAVQTAHEFLGLPVDRSVPSLWLNPAPERPMSPDVRRRLEEHFAPFNEELEDLLEQRFPWSRPRSVR